MAVIAPSLSNRGAPARTHIANGDYSLIIVGAGATPVSLVPLSNAEFTKQAGTERRVKLLGGGGDEYVSETGRKYRGTLTALGGGIDLFQTLAPAGGTEVFGTDYYSYALDSPGLTTCYVVRRIKDEQGISVVDSRLLWDLTLLDVENVFSDAADELSSLQFIVETTKRAIRFRDDCFPVFEEFTASGSSNAFVLAYTPLSTWNRRDLGKWVHQYAYFVKTMAPGGLEPYAGVDISYGAGLTIVPGTKTVTVPGANLPSGTKVRVLYLVTLAALGL